MFRRQLRLENRNQRRHGIDLKNPFTMSKNRGRGRFMLRSKLRSNFVASSLDIAGGFRAVSRSKAAPYGALRSAGRPCGGAN